MANAVAAFEPVVMVTDPEQASEARAMCGEGVEILPIPIDDSWMRDNGPIFVTDGAGGVALVHFRFNSWGNKYLPFDRDAEVPKHIAAHLGMRRYEAPMVLEGGSFFVDGEGTLLTTEQCLLNPNRNPDMTREQIERTLGRLPRCRSRGLARAGAPARSRHRRAHRCHRPIPPAGRDPARRARATRPIRTTPRVRTTWRGCASRTTRRDERSRSSRSMRERPPSPPT